MNFIGKILLKIDDFFDKKIFDSKWKLIIIGLIMLTMFVGFVTCSPDKETKIIRKRQEKPFLCEPITGEYCKEKCEPFSVGNFIPGFYLRESAEGSQRLYTSCSDSTEGSDKLISFACTCSTR